MMRWVITLITAIVMAFSISVIPVEGVSCNIPSGFSTLSSALSAGCTSIFFDGDVIDTNSVSLSGVNIGFQSVEIYGNGYTLYIASPLSPYLSLADMPALEIYNLKIVTLSPQSITFRLVNVSIYWDSVEIHDLSQLAMVFLDGTGQDNNVDIRNSILTSGVGNGINIGITSTQLNPLLNISIINTSITGFGRSLLLYLAGNLTLYNLYTDSELLFFMRSVGGSRVDATNLFIDLDDPSDYGISLYISQGYVDIYIYNYSIVGSSTLSSFIGLNIDVSTPGSVDITVDKVYMENGIYGYGSGFLLRNGRGTVFGEDIVLNMNDLFINGFSDGVSIFHIITWPIPFGPLEKLYINISNFVIDVGFSGIIFSSSPNGETYAILENGLIYSRVFGVIITSSNYIETYIERLNTTVDQISVLMYTFSYPSALSILYTEEWFDNRLSSGYSIATVEAPFFDGVISNFFNVTYSLIDMFDVVYGSGVFFETVYTPYGSQGNPFSIWTLNIQVLSSYTGMPVHGLRIDFWNGSNYITSSYTGFDGNSYTKFSYVVNPTNPFIGLMEFSIATSYFNGRWGFQSDFGYMHTLPSWYGKIILNIPLLSIGGYGFSDHIPARLVLSGDRGRIYLYPDSNSLVKDMMSPTPTSNYLDISVLDLHVYGVYIVIDAVVTGFKYPATYIRLIYYPVMGILRADGPIDMVFYAAGG